MKAARFIGMILAGIVAAYVLSLGPAFRYTLVAPNQAVFAKRARAFEAVYSPFVLMANWGNGREYLRRYLEWWRPPQPQDADLY